MSGSMSRTEGICHFLYSTVNEWWEKWAISTSLGNQGERDYYSCLLTRHFLRVLIIRFLMLLECKSMSSEECFVLLSFYSDLKELLPKGSCLKLRSSLWFDVCKQMGGQSEVISFEWQFVLWFERSTFFPLLCYFFPLFSFSLIPGVLLHQQEK